MLSVLSGQQTGIRGALQDCAGWRLRTGMAGRHEVPQSDVHPWKNSCVCFLIRSFQHYCWLQRNSTRVCWKSSNVFVREASVVILELLKRSDLLLHCPTIHPFVCLSVCSTNGTVINMSKLVKKQTHMLQNGDVIYFVYRKSEPEQSELFILFPMRMFIWIYFKERQHLPPLTL